MSSIRLADVTFAYPQQNCLIDACTLDLPPGWTGIVGRNGAGKSTLLDLIDGTIEPSTGRVDRGGLSLVRCRQSTTTADTVADFATSWSSAALRWMSLLELEPEDYWRWDTLSPGTRRRWQIGAALAGDPGALLLDEPTNHLDQHGCRLLLGALRRFRGVGLIVSHDRALLDGLCQRTVRIHRGAVRTFIGGYAEARGQWLAEEAEALAALEATQSDARALQAQLTARSTRHDSAKRSLSTRSRMTSVRDSDARSTAAKGRAERAELTLGREKAVARAQLERVRGALEAMARPEASASPILVDAARAGREIVLRFEGPLEVAGRVLAPMVHLHLRRDERLWLQGANGSGKTSLIGAALAQSDLPDDRVLFIAQELSADSARAAFEALDADGRHGALQIGAALRLDARAVVDGTALSPGELRKLTIAAGLVRQPWLIVLDEPTNDLDLDSVERLEAALSDYPGALLLVTHDAAFAGRLRATAWTPFNEPEQSTARA